MSPANDQPMPDLAFSLNQLGQETTAADLLRTRGQSQKLKVISEKKLLAWIDALIKSNLAGKADVFSDEEKQELVNKAQAEIAKRMKAEKELENERDRRAAELRKEQDKLAQSEKSSVDYEAAIAAYKSQLEQRDKTIEDVQEDNFELQDNLNQKIALLRSTIEEKERDKDKIKHSLRNQVVRSTSLLEGVIGLDNEYYGGRHQNDSPVSESASPEEQFYHDFEVGATIMQTLGTDLGRLRDIAKGAGEKDHTGLLEADLALLSQLKSGSLAALDVAQPVAGLVEASNAARNEAIALETANLEAVGGRGGTALSSVPDEDGKPAEVIAGVTQLLREMGTLLARERVRLGALKSLADQADAARNAGEEELEALRKWSEEQAGEAGETAATAKEIIQQLKQRHDARSNEVVQLKETETALRNEATALRTRLATAESANHSFADALQGLVRATAKDQGLANHTRNLEQALSNLPGDDNVAIDPAAAKQVADAGAALISGLEKHGITSAQDVEAQKAQAGKLEQQLATARKEAEAAKAELAETQARLSEKTADALETAATAKEAITTLRSQMSSRDAQLKALRNSDEELRTGIAQAWARLGRSDASNRKLAETLSALAQSELATAPDLGHLQSIEEARVDLELALSELPVEGEQGVQVSDDLAQRLADTGRKAAEALADRRRRIADTLTKAKTDADRLAVEAAKIAEDLKKNNTKTIERDSSLKRTQAELATLRSELRDQTTALADKVHDLSDARAALSANQADLDTAHQKAQAQEQALANAQADLSRARAELAKMADVQARANSAEKAHAQLAEAFSGFDNWEDRTVADIVAAQGTPLARAASRLKALDIKDSKQAAAAQAQFLQGVREQLSDLATELAGKRSELATRKGDIARMQEDLSSSKTSLVAREQEIAAAKEEVANASRRAAQAESTARELASAITLVAGDEAGALAKAVADTSKPLGSKATEAGVAAMHAVANRARSERDERQRLTADIAQAAQERDQARREQATAGQRLAKAERDATEARTAEHQISEIAAELSRDLLLSAKAMAADSDASTAKKAGDLLADFEHLTAPERIKAAVEVMPALRDVFTSLAIEAAETKANVQNNRELHEKEVAALRQDLNGLETQLLQANAELDDFRARGAESSAGTAGATAHLSQQLSANRQANQQAEADLAALRGKLTANEARLARQREEMNNRLAERDQLIAEKTREYDELASQQADSIALQAKVESLVKDLGQANEQLSRYKATHGDLTGATAQAGDLKKSLKGTEAEREQLRTKLRALESELADKRGELEEAHTALNAKASEMQALLDRKDQEVEAERDAMAALRDSEQKLKVENAGLKARVRRMTEK